MNGICARMEVDPFFPKSYSNRMSTGKYYLQSFTIGTRGRWHCRGKAERLQPSGVRFDDSVGKKGLIECVFAVAEMAEVALLT